MSVRSRFKHQTVTGLLLLALVASAHAALKVTTEQANLRSGPAVSFAVSSVARHGEPLSAKRYEAGYVQVVRPNGGSGWIHAASQGWSEDDIRSALKPAGTPAPARQAQQPARAAAPSVPSASAQPAAQAASAPHAYAVSLDNLGYQQGHYFEGAYGTHSKDFFFPLPHADGISEANLRIYFRASPMLTSASTLRFDINGKPARLVSLENREQASYVDLPLPADALHQDTLRLTVKAALLGSENRCFDERKLALHYVHIQPQTGLTLRMAQPGSVAAAWTALPPEVRIGMPKESSTASAATVLQTAVWLRDMGRKISLVPYLQPAEIVVDSEAELARRFPGALPAGDNSGGAIALARDGQGQPVILISDRLMPRPLSPQPLPWAQLLKAPQYRHGPADAPRRNAAVVDLIAAGLGDTQFVSRTVDWSLDLSPPLVPGSKRLDTLVLNIVSTPYAEQSQQLLQIYLNGMLQEVRALEQDGKPHTLRFKLDASLQRAGLNKLRIAVQRADSEGECQGSKAAFPVQVLPGSRIELADAKVDPVFFNDLRAYLASGTDIYVTPDGRANLARELAMLSAIFSNLGLNAQEMRVHFLAGNAEFKPDKPFVLVGRGSTPDKAALRFDRGRASVVDGENHVLMDLDRLPGIGAVQIVAQDSVKGVWLMAPVQGSLPDASRLHLDRDNLAFIDEHGVSFTLDSREPAVAKVDYPDYGGWQDWFDRHRFWLVALAWTLAIAVATALYRKSRQHGKG